MPDAPDIVLCSKLCRHNPTDPTWDCQGPCKCQECKFERDHIPTILKHRVTKNRLEADLTISKKNKTNMSVDNIMNLLEFVLENNYCTCTSLMALPTNKFSYRTGRRESFNHRTPPS